MLNINNFIVKLNDKPLFAPIDLLVPTGAIGVIMGPSGIGKTTLLNGLSSYKNNNEHKFTIYQESNQLFPWLSIRDNLDMVCEKPYLPLVERWNLGHLLNSTPDNISGGERQRFTLIRGICSGNAILLCDEPLSALDSFTGMRIAKDFREIVQEEKLTVLWITHNVTEAKLVGDAIYLMSKNGLRDITAEDDIIATILTC